MSAVFPIDKFDELLMLGRFKVYYQPIVHVASGRLCGYEALTHWLDPPRGLLPPSKFIAQLEEARLIHKLDAFVVDNVCQGIRYGLDRNVATVPVSINLSEIDFELSNVPELVADAIRKYDIPRGSLNIEIKESALCGDRKAPVVDGLQKMREMGCEIWIDNFARKQSPLNVLEAFRPDLLKIDIQFLRNFHSDAYSQILLKNIMNMIKEMGLRTLMVGVADEEVVNFLRQVNCEKAQGYYFGEPVPLEQTRHLTRPPEDEETRRYYNSIGRVNLLSQTPMQTIRFDEVDIGLLNRMPLAIVEFDGAKFNFIMFNESFRNAFSALGSSPEEVFNNHSLPFAIRIHNNAQQAIRSDEERVQDFVTSDGFSNVRLRGSRSIPRRKRRRCWRWSSTSAPIRIASANKKRKPSCDSSTRSTVASTFGVSTAPKSRTFISTPRGTAKVLSPAVSSNRSKILRSETFTPRIGASSSTSSMFTRSTTDYGRSAAIT